MYKRTVILIILWWMIGIRSLEKAQALGGNILHVPSEYPTIGQALAVAGSGDTVQVAAGTYIEGPLWLPEGVSLIGAGWENTLIDGNNTNVILYPGNNVLVQGFTFRNTGTEYFHAGVWIDHGTVTLRENRFTDTSTGVWAWCFEPATCNIQVTIEESLFDHNLGSGVNSNGEPVFVIRHNTVVQNGGQGVVLNHANSLAEDNIIAFNEWNGLVNPAGATVQYNNVWGNNGDYVGGGAGPGGLSADPLFRALEAGDYRLAAASPSIESGSDGSDMGVFPFTPTGIPPASVAATMTGCFAGQISWTEGSGVGYWLYYGPADRATTTRLDMGTATTYSFSDVGEADFGYASVSAYDASGQESVVTQATGSLIPCPNAPEFLQAGAFPNQEILLQWVDSSAVEAGFYLERATGYLTPTIYTRVATLPANTTSFIDTPPGLEETFWYRVQAYNSNGESAYSNESYNTTFESVPNLDEQYLLVLINEARAAPGVFGYPEIPPVPPLAYNPLLNYAAHSHSQAILNSGFQIGHCDLIGRCPTERANAVGYYGGVGENLIAGLTGPAWVESSHQAFMDSEGHRNNLLCVCFNEAGLGHTYDPQKGDAYWKGQYTETFSSRSEVVIPFLPSGIVVPYSGDEATLFTYIVNYYHADGEAPLAALVYINGTPQEMALSTGVAANGTYRLTISLSPGPHSYYFLFTFPGGSARLPLNGSFSGPFIPSAFVFLPEVVR